MIDAVFKLKEQLFRKHVLRRCDVTNYLWIGYEIEIRSHASGGRELSLKLINDRWIFPIFASYSCQSIISDNVSVAFQCFKLGDVMTDLSFATDLRKLDISDCISLSPQYFPVVD